MFVAGTWDEIQFRKNPTSHLARKIWAQSNADGTPVPADVMDWFVEDIHIQIRDYDELYPANVEVKLKHETMMELCSRLAERDPATTKISIIKWFAEHRATELQLQGTERTDPVDLLKDRLKRHL